MRPSNSVDWTLFGVYVFVVIVAGFITRPKSVQQRVLLWTVFAAVIAGFAQVVYPFARSVGYGGAMLVAAFAAGWALYDRRNDAARWMARAGDAIVLHPPFRGRWFVAAGGPDPHHNHHQAVGDQYFAYDFLNDEGPSWDQPILAPCRGMVAHVDDRHDDAAPDGRTRERKHPFGNYVSIETPRGYVILAHLKRGSIVVRPGETVGVGEEIGRCGNSGNTRGAHLHVHAQTTPFEDPGVAQGIPVAFKPSGGEALLLEYGDRLS